MVDGPDSGVCDPVTSQGHRESQGESAGVVEGDARKVGGRQSCPSPVVARTPEVVVYVESADRWVTNSLADVGQT
jgi:hypothetical protein